jgi:hypothetical protein
LTARGTKIAEIGRFSSCVTSNSPYVAPGEMVAVEIISARVTCPNGAPMGANNGVVTVSMVIARNGCPSRCSESSNVYATRPSSNRSSVVVETGSVAIDQSTILSVGTYRGRICVSKCRTSCVILTAIPGLIIGLRCSTNWISTDYVN